jgi:Uma2 family endonuclease
MAATAQAAAVVAHSQVQVGEYLGSVYRPDVDFVDGVLVDRNVGEFDHGKLQRALLFAFARLEDAGSFYTILEQRVQISADTYRVPDLCLLRNDELPEKIVYRAPLLCVEILSRRDSVAAMQSRCLDYLRMGVPEVWIVDGAERSTYVLRANTPLVAAGETLTVPGTELTVDLSAVYRVLDAASAR